MTIPAICPHWSAFVQRGCWVLARCDSPTPVEGWEGDVAEKCMLGFDSTTWQTDPAIIAMYLTEDGQILSRLYFAKVATWDAALAWFQDLAATELDAVKSYGSLRRLFLKKPA